MAKRLFLFICLITVFIIFYPLLSTFFVQDDFFLLAVSKIKTVGQFIEFFIPRNDVVWYRPLSSQVFFFLGQKLFGLRPFPYHLIQILTHFLNGYLLVVFSKQLFKKITPGLFASFIYLTNASHTVSLGWVATYSFQLGVTFLLLTIIYYLKKRKTCAVLFYLLGLLTSEVLIFTLIPLFYLEYFFLKKKITSLGIFIFFSLIIIIARFIIFPSNIGGDYQLTLNSGLLANLRFYFFRMFGLPMLIRLLMFGNTGKLLVINFLITLFIGYILPFFIIRKIEVKKIIFLLLVSLSFLIPFLLMTYHQAPYYLSYSLVGISLILGYSLNSYRTTKVKYLLLVFLLSYFSIQIISFQLTYNTHWLFKRAALAEKLVSNGVYQADIGSEEYFALGANYALSVYQASLEK